MKDGLIIWHYKEANRTHFEASLCYLGYLGTKGGLKIVFHSKCTSQRHKKGTSGYENM